MSKAIKGLMSKIVSGKLYEAGNYANVRILGKGEIKTERGNSSE